jgi:hypothetical protein
MEIHYALARVPTLGEGEYGIHGLLWLVDSGDRPLINRSRILAGKKFLLNDTRENK